jgi:uncharacterized membrane protein
LSKPGGECPHFDYTGIISLGMTNRLIFVILRMARILIAGCPTKIALAQGNPVRQLFISFNQPNQKIVGEIKMAEKNSFLVIKYPKADTASQAMGVLRELAKNKVIKLEDAVELTKTTKGKLKIHQSSDDRAGKGFVKGGVIGIILAALFGPAAWIAVGAAAGTGLAMFDRGIKNKLLKELGQKMTASESAVALLVEQADWPKAVETMKFHKFQGEVVVSEIVEKDMEAVEKLLKDQKTVASVPEELEVTAPPASDG